MGHLFPLHLSWIWDPVVWVGGLVPSGSSAGIFLPQSWALVHTLVLFHVRDFSTMDYPSDGHLPPSGGQVGSHLQGNRGLEVPSWHPQNVLASTLVWRSDLQWYVPHGGPLPSFPRLVASRPTGRITVCSGGGGGISVSSLIQGSSDCAFLLRRVPGTIRPRHMAPFWGRSIPSVQGFFHGRPAMVSPALQMA